MIWLKGNLRKLWIRLMKDLCDTAAPELYRACLYMVTKWNAEHGNGYFAPLQGFRGGMEHCSCLLMMLNRYRRLGWETGNTMKSLRSVTAAFVPSFTLVRSWKGCLAAAEHLCISAGEKWQWRGRLCRGRLCYQKTSRREVVTTQDGEGLVHTCLSLPPEMAAGTGALCLEDK